jgi:H+-transporting ATPase
VYHCILLQITTWLLVLSLTLCIIIFAVLMATPDPAGYVVPSNQSKVIRSLSVTIVILVASIPIAIEVVCTSTLAVGSHIMAEKKVIVAKLSAIEELAGMTILCSDKTGTLTLNKLSLREPIVLAPGATAADIVFFAALASKRESSNQDAIDFCITRGVDVRAAAFSPALRPPDACRLTAVPFSALVYCRTPTSPPCTRTVKRTSCHSTPRTSARSLL